MNNYIFKRLDESLMHLLPPLYKDALDVEITVDQVVKKFDTADYSGKKNISFVAIDEDTNMIAAIYPVFPAIIRYNNEDILCGQVGDLMTHSLHRRKGLFLKLAELTHQLAKEEGLKLIFTFTYGENTAFQGFIQRLGFFHKECLNSYKLPVGTIPLCRILKKTSATAALYELYLKTLFALFYHRQRSFDLQCSKNGYLLKNKAFFDYKLSYSAGHIIRFYESFIWFKLTKYGSASVGDIADDTDPGKIIDRFKRFCFLAGIRAIQIETSADTALDIYLRSGNTFSNDYHLSMLKIDNDVPCENFKFVFGDLDNF